MESFRELNDNGIKPRKGERWAKSSVARILRNSTYAGTNITISILRLSRLISHLTMRLITHDERIQVLNCDHKMSGSPLTGYRKLSLKTHLKERNAS